MEYLLSILQKAGKKKIALISDQDQFFEAMGNAVVAKAPEYGISVIRDSGYQMGSADFRSSILKHKNSGVDAFWLALGSEENILQFLRQRHQLMPDVPMYGSEFLNSYAEKAEYRQFMGGLTWIVPPQIHSQKFVTTYKDRFKTEPLVSAANAYDAANILLAAFDNEINTPEALSGYFHREEFKTVSYGNVRFDQIGNLATDHFEVRSIPSH